jgi:type III secretion system FlhB-like substrate exporter
MGIFTAFSNLFAGRNFSNISADQEKALIDTLTYAMAADHKVTPTEEQELAQGLRNVDWDESVPLDSYVHESVARAKTLTNEQGDAAAYCRDIAKRLGGDWLREETYYLAARIAAADQEIASEEQVLLHTIVEAFELDDAAQAKISDQLLRETQF